ncbi:MAG: MoaD/ThiS family protein [Chlorobi bacterium]|nr:MoaD/ThiS family protein [Chlorobiota bacterium]
MTILVRYFGPAREAVGLEEESLTVGKGVTVSEVRSALLQQHPELAFIAEASRFAVNMKYSADNEPVPEGAEFAIIPPVAGG